MLAIVFAWHKVEYGNEHGVGDGDNTTVITMTMRTIQEAMAFRKRYSKTPNQRLRTPTTGFAY